MKKFLGFFILVFLVFSFAGCAGCGDSTETMAVVNGEEITKEEFETNFEQIKIAYENQGASIEGLEDEIREQLLEELINQQILRQEAEKRDIEIDNDEVEKEIKKIKEEFESEEEFNELLDFYGMNREILKENIFFDILVNKLREQVIDKDEIEVTEEELKERYEEEEYMFKEQQEMIDGQITEEMREEMEKQELEELESDKEFEDFEELEPVLRDLIKQEKKQEMFYNIVEELKEESEIEIM